MFYQRFSTNVFEGVLKFHLCTDRDRVVVCELLAGEGVAGGAPLRAHHQHHLVALGRGGGRGPGLLLPAPAPTRLLLVADCPAQAL